MNDSSATQHKEGDILPTDSSSKAKVMIEFNQIHFVEKHTRVVWREPGYRDLQGFYRPKPIPFPGINN